MREVIKQAATVDEAIELALRELSLTREQVTCEVLEYPERKFIFRKPAKVKVVEIEEEFDVKELFKDKNSDKPQPKAAEKPAKKEMKKQPKPAEEKQEKPAETNPNRPSPPHSRQLPRRPFSRKKSPSRTHAPRLNIRLNLSKALSASSTQTSASLKSSKHRQAISSRLSARTQAALSAARAKQWRQSAI